MQKFIESIKETERIINNADHMFYVTFPLIKDKKLLLKIILEIKKAIVNCINLILKREYLFKRISLYKDPRSNFSTFKEKCAPRYNITNQEIKLIMELFEIFNKHKQSSMEIMKNDRIFIISENLELKMIQIEKIREFLTVSKEILKKTKTPILRKI